MKKIIFLFLFFISTISFSQIIDSVFNDSLAHRNNLDCIPIPIVLHSPETSFGFGAGGILTFKSSKKDTLLRTSSIDAFGLYTLKNQIVIASEGAIYLPKEKYILKFLMSFSHYPDKFWGIGNNSSDAQREDYSFTQYYFHPQMVRKTRTKFFAGISYETQNMITVSYIENGIFTAQNVTGRNGGKISGAGILLAWDSRNAAFSPDKGEFVQFSASHFNKFAGSDFDFSSYLIDARKYFSTVHKQVLSLQAISISTTGTVPFRNMPSLGGPNLLRGYFQGRFRDKNLLAFQTEYRIPLWKRLGAVIFSGIGEVSDKIKYTIAGMKYTYGGGIRFALKKKDQLNLRVDYGRGYKSDGIYFLLSEAF